MSDPIVIELQRFASDSSCCVDDLLRKAFIVATKLKIDDFKDWVNYELNGYPSRNHTPEYRKTLATFHVFNDVLGRLMPLYMPEQMELQLRQVSLTQPLSAFVELATTDSSEFHIHMPPQVRNLLLEGQDFDAMEPVMKVSRLSITSVIEAVRNTILDWSLQLEGQGILGEGMRFTPEEKSAAAASPNIHIGSFQGVLGDVTNSTVTQNQKMTINAGDFDDLKQKLAGIGVDADDIKSLKVALESDPEPESATKFGPRVSEWIGTMMGKAADGTWQVGLAVASNLLAKCLAAYYGLEG